MSTRRDHGKIMKRALVILCTAILCLAQAVPFSFSHGSSNVLAQSNRMQEAAATARLEGARDEKLPMDLVSMIAMGRNDKPQDFIVQTTEPPTSAHRQLVSQYGGTIKHQFKSIN